MAIQQTAGRDALGGFAPQFAALNDDVLFKEVWSRENELSLCDRSLVTVLSLMAMGLTDSSFQYHLETAKKNGITKKEIAAAITHASFYVGWPKAWAAFRMAKDVWSEETAYEDAKKEHEKHMIFPIGNPNDEFSKYFIGQSYLALLIASPVSICNVTFEPKCRNKWHVHQADKGGGQILIGMAGVGCYQEWGKDAVWIQPGDVIHIQPGIKHWHGAAPDSWFSYLAIEVPGENCRNEWLEPVSEECYQPLTKEKNDE